MTDRSSNLNGAMIFEKRGNFWSHKMRTIIIKNRKEKFKNKNKRIEPKIMNNFLISRLIIFCPYKFKKIVHYHQNLAKSCDVIKKPDGSNLIYTNDSPRCITKDWPKVNINPFWSIKLTIFARPTILFQITNLG